MQKQQGFIQGALLIGIALLAVVIGAFAMASNNNTSDTSKEKVKTNAAVSVKKMADTFELYQITAAQKDVSAADTTIGALNVTLPQGFGKNVDAENGLVYTGAAGAGEAKMTFAVADQLSCAQVNRVLGLATADVSDADAVTAGGSKDESCVSAGYGGGFSYTRLFRKA